MQNQRNREDRSYSGDDRFGRDGREQWRQGRNSQEGRWQASGDEDMSGGRYGQDRFDRGPAYYSGSERYGSERFDRGPEYYGPGRFERESDSLTSERHGMMDDSRRFSGRGGYNTGYSGGSYSSGNTGYTGSGGYGAGGYGGGWQGGENSGYYSQGQGQGRIGGGGFGSPRSREFVGGGDTGWRGGEHGSFGMNETHEGSISGFGSRQPRREFFGKGPKGYSRSDERIREEVCERLAGGYLDASDIEVTVTNGEVTLSGFVRDRQTKRLAEELAEAAMGVKDIENKLKVKSVDDHLSQHQTGQQTQSAHLQGTIGTGAKAEGKTEGAGGTARENNSRETSATSRRVNA